MVAIAGFLFEKQKTHKCGPLFKEQYFFSFKIYAIPNKLLKCSAVSTKLDH